MTQDTFQQRRVGECSFQLHSKRKHWYPGTPDHTEGSLLIPDQILVILTWCEAGKKLSDIQSPLGIWGAIEIRRKKKQVVFSLISQLLRKKMCISSYYGSLWYFSVGAPRTYLRLGNLHRAGRNNSPPLGGVLRIIFLQNAHLTQEYSSEDYLQGSLTRGDPHL